MNSRMFTFDLGVWIYASCLPLGLVLQGSGLQRALFCIRSSGNVSSKQWVEAKLN